MWQQKDFISRNELQTQQLSRLRDTVHHAYTNVPFYRKKLDESGVHPRDIKSLDDIRALPFTTKEDMRSNYPYGLFAVPMKEVLRIHASSGTTGRPVVMGYTRKDLENWMEQVGRICLMAGMHENDIVQISFGYGLFTGGFGLHGGVEKLGATVVPFSSGNTERQLMLMQDFQTNVLVSTPSFALYMAEAAQEMGFSPRSFGLRLGLFGGEPCPDNLRRAIEDRWGLKATLNYGLTEIVGPGVSGECEVVQGMHICEDHFYPEIIDPDSLQPLPPGEEGEMVFTTLSKEGVPVIRYRTRDITSIIPETCPCGRTTRRMSYITGRTDDMLIVKGVNVFPSQVEEVLAQVEEVSPYYVLVVHREKDYIKDVEVQVELTEEGFTDSFRELQKIEEKISSRLKAVLSVTLRVRLMEPKSLERTTGKAQRIVENKPAQGPHRQFA